MERALYDPDHGFYATGGQAGRRGDFLTSVEVGPLFGAVVARALDAWWEEAGSPRPFVVVDAGAGAGTLARSVLRAEPSCAAALRYVLVERSASLRVAHPDGLPLTMPAHAFAVGRDPDEDEGAPRRSVPDGPIAVSLSSLPPPDTAHVVLANELLDNLPVRILERTAGGWAEVGVADAALGDGRGLVEVLLPFTEVEPRLDAAPGARIAWQTEAAQWVRGALDVAPRVVVIDYMTTTAEMAARPWREWLRTYRGHERGGAPLDDLGGQDITCEVALDQLSAVRAPTLVTDQRTFLTHHGIDGLVAEGRAAWEAGAAQGDLASLRGRSRIREAEALMEMEGLGAFTVAEWTR